MTIRSKVATEEYRRGWDATFGKPTEPEDLLPFDDEDAWLSGQRDPIMISREKLDGFVDWDSLPDEVKCRVMEPAADRLDRERKARGHAFVTAERNRKP